MMESQDSEKLGLVERLVDLTVRNPVGAISGNPTDIDMEMHEQIRQRARQQQIDVRLKHFTTEQVRALLDFYESDMGRSIIESEKRIAEEFIAGFQIMSGEVTEKYAQKRREHARRLFESKSDSKNNQQD